MKYRTQLRPGLLVMLLVACAAAEANTLSIKAENDIISSGSDGHYSNGLEVIWGFEPEQDQMFCINLRTPATCRRLTVSGSPSSPLRNS